MRGGPWREMARMEQEMDELFRKFPGESPLLPFGGEGRAWAPSVDMIDRTEELLVRADLPGLEQKDVEVSVEDGMLTIRGERKEEKEAKEGDYYCCERWAGAFARTVALPAGIDTDKVKAAFRNGVLEVHLPKTKEAKARKIDIKIE